MHTDVYIPLHIKMCVNTTRKNWIDSFYGKAWQKFSDGSVKLQQSHLFNVIKDRFTQGVGGSLVQAKHTQAEVNKALKPVYF